MAKVTNAISKKFKLNKSLVSRDSYTFQKEVLFDIIKTFFFKRGFLISDFFSEERRRSLLLNLTFFPYANFVPNIFQMFSLKKVKKHKTRKKLVVKLRGRLGELPFSGDLETINALEGLKYREFKVIGQNHPLLWDEFPDPFYKKTARLAKEKEAFYRKQAFYNNNYGNRFSGNNYFKKGKKNINRYGNKQRGFNYYNGGKHSKKRGAFYHYNNYHRNKNQVFTSNIVIPAVKPYERLNPFMKRRKFTKHYFTKRQMFWNPKRKATGILKYELGLYTTWPKNLNVRADIIRVNKKKYLSELKRRYKERLMRFSRRKPLSRRLSPRQFRWLPRMSLWKKKEKGARFKFYRVKTLLIFKQPFYNLKFSVSFRNLQKLDHAYVFPKTMLNDSTHSFLKASNSSLSSLETSIYPFSKSRSSLKGLAKPSLLVSPSLDCNFDSVRPRSLFNKGNLLFNLYPKSKTKLDNVQNFAFSYNLKKRDSLEATFPIFVSSLKKAFGSSNIVIRIKRLLWFDLLLSNGAYEYNHYDDVLTIPTTKLEKYSAFKRYFLPFFNRKRFVLRGLFSFSRPFYFYRSGILASFLMILFHKVDPSNLLYIFSKFFKRINKKKQKFFISRLAKILKALVDISSSLSWSRIRILGVKMEVNGRLRGKLKASTFKFVYGLGIPGQTQSALTEYCYRCFKTRKYGTYGFKIWLYHEKRSNVIYF